MPPNTALRLIASTSFMRYYITYDTCMTIWHDILKCNVFKLKSCDHVTRASSESNIIYFYDTTTAIFS